MPFGQMGWGQPMYGYMQQMQQVPNMGAMPDQLAQLRAQQAAQSQQQQQAQGGLIWVQGEAGAKSYLVAPGQHVQLMDSEAEVFYIKSADPSGVPLPLRTFDYKERKGAQQTAQAARQPATEYVTRSEYDALAAKLADVTSRLDAMMSASIQTSEAPREHARRRVHREEEAIDA